MEKNSIYTKKLQGNYKFLFTLQNHTVLRKEVPMRIPMDCICNRLLLNILQVISQKYGLNL